MGSKQLCYSHFKANIPILGHDLGKTSFKDIVFARGEFLSFVGNQNESLKLIIIYYIKHTFGTKTTFLDSLRSQKGPLTARFLQN